MTEPKPKPQASPASGVIGLVVIGFIVWYFFFRGGDTATPGSVATQRPVAQPPAAAGIGDGKFRVGTDIQPATYRLRSPSSACYWARLKGFSGELGDIIANENLTGYGIVTIGPSDAGFQTSGCGGWSKDLSAVITQGSTIPDGYFIVGVDIRPGTYRSSGGSCYWARLSASAESSARS